MRIGVMLDSNVGAVGRPAPSRAEVAEFHRAFLDFGRRLDGSAVSGLYVAERHGRTDCFSPAPLEQLAALAACTESARLGTYVMMPPLYPTVSLLERLAVIDHLSGGRLVCGFGAGFHPRYFAVHGQEMAGRGKRLDEFLRVMREVWAGGAAGGTVRLGEEDVYVVPPLQEPGPPVWVGGTSDAAVRRAARFADAFAIGFTDRHADALVEKYRAECAAVGREPRLVLIQSAWVRDDVDAGQEALHYLGETLGPEMTLYQSHGQLKASGEITAGRMLPYMYVGTSDEVIAKVRRDAARWDVEEVVLRVHIGIPPRDVVGECLRTITDVVAPSLVA
jgi:alkanesulfonate monooxygenase SsuD/methylene tetrahydromethanopterin reductase-like flavin-dependent oxidoreductase (luciferase family)